MGCNVCTAMPRFVFLGWYLAHGMVISGNMRRVFLVGSFLALLAAVYGLWSFRFEMVPDSRTWSLADLRVGVPEVAGVSWGGTSENPSLRLELPEGGQKTAIRLGIPGINELRFVYLSYRLSSQNLEPGRQKWEDGRFLIEWHGGGREDLNYVASIRGSQTGSTKRVVIDAESWPAVPALRLEHLGRSGGFELTDLRITPVRERVTWKVGKWFLSAAWLVWGTLWMRSWPGVSKLRALCASGVGLVMVFSLMVPGPWDEAHPFGERFFLGGPTREGAEEVAKHGESDIASAAIPPSGRLEEKGSLLLRVKLRISQARWLLHFLLWAGSSMVFAVLVGRRPAISMSALLALGMELAQWAFGFGHDWVDLADLFFDASGIALAMWLYSRWFMNGAASADSTRSLRESS